MGLHRQSEEIKIGREERRNQENRGSDPDDGRQLVDIRQAVIGGVVAMIAAIAGIVIAGSVGGAKARILVEAISPTVRFMSSGVMAACATILALMLTLMSLTHGMQENLKDSHFQRVRQISLASVVSLVVSVVMLIVISIPFSNSQNFPPGWWDGIYYGLVALVSIAGGLFVAIVLMLYRAISHIVEALRPTGDSPVIE